MSDEGAYKKKFSWLIKKTKVKAEKKYIFSSIILKWQEEQGEDKPSYQGWQSRKVERALVLNDRIEPLNSVISDFPYYYIIIIYANKFS